jgi:hypothetical protein
MGAQTRSLETDRERIDSPMEWPGLRLPLKNPGRYNTEKPSLGWLWTSMEWPGAERTVYLGNVFDNEPADEEIYQDTWALLDAGWQVD